MCFLVRRLATRYDYTTIALILSRQRRRTGTGLAFTEALVKKPAGLCCIAVYPDPHRPTVRDRLAPEVPEG